MYIFVFYLLKRATNRKSEMKITVVEKNDAQQVCGCWFHRFIVTPGIGHNSLKKLTEKGTMAKERRMRENEFVQFFHQPQFF